MTTKITLDVSEIRQAILDFVRKDTRFTEEIDVSNIKLDPEFFIITADVDVLIPF